MRHHAEQILMAHPPFGLHRAAEPVQNAESRVIGYADRQPPDDRFGSPRFSTDPGHGSEAQKDAQQLPGIEARRHRDIGKRNYDDDGRNVGEKNALEREGIPRGEARKQDGQRHGVEKRDLDAFCKAWPLRP